MRIAHRRSVRLRLSLLYSGLFLLSATALLTLVYLMAIGKITGDPLFDRYTVTRGTRPADVLTGPTSQVGAGPPQVRQFLIFAGITVPVMLAVSAALGWLMAGRVLRPLRTITATTRRISETNLHQRLAVTGPDDELKDLADTIDGLLARLDAAFDAQKDALDAQQRFAANASHELRRPLTLQRAALEIALADPDAPAHTLRSTCTQVLSASRQQERLIDALLTLARGQQGLDRHEPFELAAIVDEVLLARRRHVDDRRLRLDSTLKHAPATGDSHLAERLVTNLVDNAIHHNVPGGWLELTTMTEPDHAVLRITNSGPAVPSSDVDRLLRPFQRLGTDRTNPRHGHGLGLSIVAAIAAAHDADLHIQARPAGGLDIIVRFPLAHRHQR
jgi:signal transduction histidine kinase